MLRKRTLAALIAFPYIAGALLGATVLRPILDDHLRDQECARAHQDCSNANASQGQHLTQQGVHSCGDLVEYPAILRCRSIGDGEVLCRLSKNSLFGKKGAQRAHKEEAGQAHSPAPDQLRDAQTDARGRDE